MSSSATRSPRCSTTRVMHPQAPGGSISLAPACCRGSSTRTCTSRAWRSAAGSCGCSIAGRSPSGRARPGRGKEHAARRVAARPRLARRVLEREAARQALDAVAPGVRVALRSHDGHSLWLNSAALAAAGGDLAVPGGVVETDAAGEPTGILREDPAGASTTLTPPRASSRRSTQCAARSRRPRPPASPASTTRTAGAARPTLRCAARRGRADAAGVAVPARRAPHRRRHPAAARLRCCGSATSRRSWTARSAHARRGSSTGRACRSRAPRPWQSSSARPRPPARAGGTRDRRPGQPRRARRLRRGRDARCAPPDRACPVRCARGRRPLRGVWAIAASVQYTHATSDSDLVERIWADRVEHAYPFRSLWESGARLAGGSDAPVEELDPLAGLRAAVLRTDSEGPGVAPRTGDPCGCCTSLLHGRASVAELRRAPARTPARRVRCRPRRARPRPARPPTRIRGRRSRRRNHAGGRVGARSLREPFEPLVRTATARV